MPRISTDNYDTVASWNGSQDLFVVEQPDGTKVATPEQVKQYVLGDMDEVPTQNSNDTVKSGGVFSAVDDVYSVMGQMGAKNLIPYPFSSDSYSQRDIDFTCLSDGTINANGTNDGTGNSTYNFVAFTLSKGSYVINGCPIQTGNNYRCGVVRTSDDVTLASDYGSGANFTLDTDTRVRIFVQVYRGKTANNIIFKPMIRLAADTDDSYQPYAKTNRQLTDEIGDLSQTGLTGDSVAAQLDTARGQISQLNTNIKDFKNLFVSHPESTTETYTFSIPANAIAELTAVLGTNLAKFYIIAASTTLRVIKQTDDVTGLDVTLDSISGGVYNYTVTIPAYALSVAYRIS